MLEFRLKLVPSNNLIENLICFDRHLHYDFYGIKIRMTRGFTESARKFVYGDSIPLILVNSQKI